MTTLSPFNCLRVNASSVHYLLESEPEQRKESILECLRTNHGVKHVNERDVNSLVYKKWKKDNEQHVVTLKKFEKTIDQLREEEVQVPEGIYRPLVMEIGIDEELRALKLLEDTLNESASKTSGNANGWVITPDQTRRTLLVNDNIELIGRFDARIEKVLEGGKRVIKGIVEVKTRMNEFRENPADLTQLTIYSRMASNADKLTYILLEYLPMTKEMKRTPIAYSVLLDHWEKIVYPGLVRIYPEVCDVWRERMDVTHPSYVGHEYGKRAHSLIDKVLLILRAPSIDGDKLLISLLESSKIAILEELELSYKALCRLVTAEVKLRVKNRDLAFFRENIQSIVHISEDNKVYRDHLKNYSSYLADIVKDNVTEKTRGAIWELVDEVLATV